MNSGTGAGIRVFKGGWDLRWGLWISNLVKDKSMLGGKSWLLVRLVAVRCLDSEERGW